MSYIYRSSSVYFFFLKFYIFGAIIQYYGLFFFIFLLPITFIEFFIFLRLLKMISLPKLFENKIRIKKTFFNLNYLYGLWIGSLFLAFGFVFVKTFSQEILFFINPDFDFRFGFRFNSKGLSDEFSKDEFIQKSDLFLLVTASWEETVGMMLIEMSSDPAKLFLMKQAKQWWIARPGGLWAKELSKMKLSEVDWREAYPEGVGLVYDYIIQPTYSLLSNYVASPTYNYLCLPSYNYIGVPTYNYLLSPTYSYLLSPTYNYLLSPTYNYIVYPTACQINQYFVEPLDEYVMVPFENQIFWPFLEGFKLSLYYTLYYPVYYGIMTPTYVEIVEPLYRNVAKPMWGLIYKNPLDNFFLFCLWQYQIYFFFEYGLDPFFFFRDFEAMGGGCPQCSYNFYYQGHFLDENLYSKELKGIVPNLLKKEFYMKNGDNYIVKKCSWCNSRWTHILPYTGSVNINYNHDTLHCWRMDRLRYREHYYIYHAFYVKTPDYISSPWFLAWNYNLHFNYYYDS